MFIYTYSFANTKFPKYQVFYSRIHHTFKAMMFSRRRREDKKQRGTKWSDFYEIFKHIYDFKLQGRKKKNIFLLSDAQIWKYK